MTENIKPKVTAEELTKGQAELKKAMAEYRMGYKKEVPITLESGEVFALPSMQQLPILVQKKMEAAALTEGGDVEILVILIDFMFKQIDKFPEYEAPLMLDHPEFFVQVWVPWTLAQGIEITEEPQEDSEVPKV